MRHVRAADRRCTATFRGIYLRTAHRHVRTPQNGFSCEHQADRATSRQRRRYPLSRSRRSARGGTWARRNAPRSRRAGISIFRRRIFAYPNSNVAQTVEEPFLCPVAMPMAIVRDMTRWWAAPCFPKMLHAKGGGGSEKLRPFGRATSGLSAGTPAVLFRCPVSGVPEGRVGVAEVEIRQKNRAVVLFCLKSRRDGGIL